MFDYIIKRPMIIAAVGCILSAVCGFYCNYALVGCLLLTLGIMAFAVFKRKAPIIVALVLILVVIIGCFLTLNKIEKLEGYIDCNISADVCVYSTTYKNSDYYRTDVEVLNSNTLPRGTKLSLWHSPVIFKSGEIINAGITLNEIYKDYKGSYYGNGIYLSGKLNQFTRKEERDEVLSLIGSLRDYIKNLFFENMAYESAATMCALVFGERGYFTDEFYNNVKASGVAHTMVVSGMHLSVLVTMVLKIIQRFIYNPYLKAFIMFCTVITVCGVCGFTMSIMRAGVTYIITAVGLLLNRTYSGENALGAAVVFILMFSPFAILSVGFQLSVLSTFGILAVATPISEYLKKKNINKIIRKALDSVLLSLSATLLTLPVAIHIFGYVSSVSVITNLLIDIPLSFCLCLSVIALILNRLIPFASALALKLIDYVTAFVNSTINYFGSRDYAVVTISQKGAYISVFVILALFQIMLTCKARQNMLKSKEMNEKILKEGKKNGKWQSFLKKP